MKDLIIPEGYTTKKDEGGECFECDFCIMSKDKDAQCGHPTPASTGCADHDVVFIKED